MAVLDKLEALYCETGDIRLKPDRISYNSVIKALARSVEDGAALQAETYLIKMKAAYNAGDANIAPDCRTVRLLFLWLALLTMSKYMYVTLYFSVLLSQIMFITC